MGLMERELNAELAKDFPNARLSHERPPVLVRMSDALTEMDRLAAEIEQAVATGRRKLAEVKRVL